MNAGRGDNEDRTRADAFDPWWRTRAIWIALAIGVVLYAAFGFLPLVGGPGYEAAVVGGLVFPALAAIAAALDVSSPRSQNAQPIAAYWRGFGIGLLALACLLIVSWLHGFRVGFCDPAEDTLRLLLGPGIGAVLGGVWGAACGLFFGSVSRRDRRIAFCIVAGVAAPALSVCVSVVRYYTSPLVFFFDPFVGFFSGAFYDTDLGGLGRLWTYRAGSVATLVAAGALALHGRRDERSRLAWVWPDRAWSWVCAAAAVTSVTLMWLGPALGHFHTEGSIRAALGRELATERCDIIYDRTLTPRYVERLGRECDAHMAALERFFDAPYEGRPQVYVFVDRGQKRALMGACAVDMAKPWRGEAYVEQNGYPHPVLGHELAHVVAGDFATGPFRVPGPVVMPNAGLIEGTAVAAAPRESENLTPQEWAAAMLKLGVLPEMAPLFGAAGFFGKASSTAYTAAGAFVSWVRERYGAEALRRWYGGEALDQVTGRSLPELESDWRASLATIPVSEAALRVAKARFDRPGVFSRRCPHVVDRLGREAGNRASRGDLSGALEKCNAVLALDSGNVRAQRLRADMQLRAGDRVAALAALEAIASDERHPGATRAAAVERIADIAFADGDLSAAQARYAEVVESRVGEDALRNLDVKLDAAPDTAPALGEFLIGDPVQGRDATLSTLRVAEWAAADPTRALPEYLLGRALWFRDRPVEAAEHLDRALARRFDLPRVEREALRLRIVVACSEQDRVTAQRLLERWRALPGTSEARRAGLEAFAARCGLS